MPFPPFECPECFTLSDQHKFSCSRRRDAAMAVVDWKEIRSTGKAAVLYYKGLPSEFDCPMVTKVVGNLWQGGCEDGVRLGEEFTTVVSLYPWGKWTLGPNTTRYEFEMRDSEEGVPVEQLFEASDAVLEGLRKGRTLVHCQAGLNRSGLVAAFTMMRLGWRVDEAMDLLRSTRSDMVLCNETFVSQLVHLQNEFDQSRMEHLKVHEFRMLEAPMFR